uniref:Protein-tyrosine phosphatase receptor IA-2 ectodomain domain-containing protein n=1 Tax=Timema cristinae TaxID=61476 RepID=A0A7R9CWD0_TIMCR|nr:unnamed protein product [Timema cristinae]
MGNPFIDCSEELVTLDSRLVVETIVVTELKNIQNLGQQEAQEYFQLCLVNRTEYINAAVKKNQILLFNRTSGGRALDRSKEQLLSFKWGRTLFLHLCISCHVLQGNLDNFFCNENQTPPALSKNSDLRFGNKFDLVDCLESLLPEEYLILTTDVDMIIIDGATAANIVHPDGGQTFFSYGRRFLDFLKSCLHDATPHESPEKKEVVFSAGVPTSTALRYDVVDTTYAYVAFKTSIYEWEKGSTIVKKVAELLKLPFKTFKNIRRISDVCKVHLNKDPQELEQKKLWDVNTPGTIYEWEKGSTIVKKVAELLKLPFKTFKNIRRISDVCKVHLNKDPQELEQKKLWDVNTPGTSSSEIIGGMAVLMSAVFRHNLLEISRGIPADELNALDIKEELQTQTGVEVTSAGIGDKRNILLIMSGAYRTVATDALIVTLGVWPLNLLIRKKGIRYWLKKNKLDKMTMLTSPKVNNAEQQQQQSGRDDGRKGKLGGEHLNCFRMLWTDLRMDT